MRRSVAITALMFLAPIAACQAGPDAATLTEAEANAVRSLLEETYAQAILEGDIEAATSLWAEDALRVPPHAASLEGYDAIRASYEAMPYEVTALEWSDVDVQGSGDLAFMRGDYSFAAESDDAAFSETGTSFVVFRRDDGEWKVTANMWRPDPAVAEGSDIEAIKGLHPRRLEAAAAVDIDAFLGFMTDDAAMMPPDAPAIAGHEALRSYFEEAFNAFEFDVRKPVSDVTVIGDWAFEDYTYELTMTPRAGGQPITESGKGMFVYRRGTDGQWRVARDVWNHDAP